MDIKKVTSEYRTTKWAEVIKAQVDSGQSIKDFCQAAGISRHAYFYWQKKLRMAACTELSRTVEISRDIVPNGWMQLETKQDSIKKDILNIEINGCHISVGSETDSELLKKVCRILRLL
jgi:putative transposase